MKHLCLLSDFSLTTRDVSCMARPAAGSASATLANSRGREGVETCYLIHCAEELRETLLETPQEETVEAVRRFTLENEKAVKLIVAGWINGRKGDGRLCRTVQEWASNVTSREFFGCPLHSCYLNAVAWRLFVAPTECIPMF